MNVLKNRTNCMNNVRVYINEIAPQIIKELEKGFSLTKDNRLFKKDKERISAIINSKKHFRAILTFSDYSIALTVDDYYKTAEYTCAYYKEYVYLWDLQSDHAYPLERMEPVTVKQLENAGVELRDLENKRSEIGSRISKLQKLLGA